jgi:hypothetical protein
MNWHSLPWAEFERALVEYRDRSPTTGENAYLELVAEVAGVPIRECEAHVESIVLFLNPAWSWVTAAVTR